MKDQIAHYKAVIPNDKHLALFLRTIQRFDENFCKFMNEGREDFCLKLEVRGNKSGIVHCRTSTDDYERP